jgi:hypothetical protein
MSTLQDPVVFELSVYAKAGAFTVPVAGCMSLDIEVVSSTDQNGPTGMFALDICDNDPLCRTHVKVICTQFNMTCEFRTE